MPQKQPAQASTQVVNLDERGAAYKAGKLDVRFVCALATRYNIEAIERRLGPDRNVTIAISDYWADLALALARHYVPAFAIRRRSGAKKKKHRESGPNWPYAHEARLVQLVDHFKKENIQLGLSHTRPTLFKKISQHSIGYSWKYKDLKKRSSFTQEWKIIPRKVKEEPSRFLPPRKLPRYAAGVAPQSLVRPEFQRLQKVLPPVPRPRKR
jgi:hypothetical protein